MKRKLLDLVRDKIRFKHYSIKTEQFLTYLAVNKKVSPTTQN